MAKAAGGIRAVEFTSCREGDSPVLAELLDQIPQGEEIGTVTGKLPTDAPLPIGLEPLAAARRAITPMAGLEDRPHPGKKAVPRCLARHDWNQLVLAESTRHSAPPRARPVRAGKPRDGGVCHGAAPVRSRRRPSGSDRWRRDGQLRGTWPAPMPSA